ncbi:lipopolysaccharide biosynthesis protein [Bacteroides sp. K03]|uniref:lipopolysaccharide biosynthesis protein n=1 Tax=Bacteroides TaxID=816 RepID=UPI001C8CD280|nr:MULTISPECIES: lipopolysaccharide biosynthesis protein [Bacteroides]MBX9188539.1 lipopolysaccharide biosynthesis protein [Bacteroides sp. K03]
MASNLKQQLFSGVFYTALAKYSGIIISLVVAGVLARLLSPDDFGIVAIATVIIAFFGIFTDMGISPAIIQDKTLTEHELSDIFSFTLWMGIGLSVLFFAASWSIAAYYDSPILRILCQLLCLNLFFASANIVPNALFYKNKEFKFIALRSFGIQVASGVAAVIAALSGAGLYALIISPILSSILIFGISIKRYPQRASLTLGLKAIRKIFSYSVYQFLFNVINYFSRNLDKLLIGKYMSMSQLGYYEKSYRLMMLPLQNITQVITPVMHPVFSDYQNDLQRLSSAYERIMRLLAFIGIPLSVLLFFTAREVTLIIFGDQWLPSIPVFRILTLSVGIQIILSSSGSIFQAAGDTRSLFICGLFSSVLNVSGMLLGIFWFGTLEAVAWCIVITFCINFIQCYWQMYRITLKRSMWTLLRQFASPIIVSMLITAALLPLHYLTEGDNIFFTLLLKSIISFLIFGLYIQTTHEYDLIRRARGLVEKLRKKINDTNK